MTISASSFLHYWSARYGAVPIVGGAPHHTRSSAGRWVDQQGILQSAIVNTPRFEYATVSGERRAVMRLEAARTNVVTYSRDLTNGAWTKTNVTASKDQIGADGTANGASKIVATAGNGTCLQAITLASSARYQSAYVRRLVGSGAINMTMDNGATWTVITVTADWTRVTIPTQTLANPTVGFRIVTNTDAIAVDFVQNENGVSGSAPIDVTATAATRATDTFYWDYTPAPQAMMVYLRFVERGTLLNEMRTLVIGKSDDSNPKAVILGFGGSYYLSYHNGSALVQVSVTGPAVGDVTEIVAILKSDGKARILISINQGAVSDSGESAANALPAAWSDTRLWPNGISGFLGLGDYAEVKAVKYADVASTAAADIMAELRAVELTANGELVS